MPNLGFEPQEHHLRGYIRTSNEKRNPSVHSFSFESRLKDEIKSKEKISFNEKNMMKKVLTFFSE